MAKKKTASASGKKKAQPKGVKKKTQQASENHAPIESEDVDFGGLPRRDLKKNLGCG